MHAAVQAAKSGVASALAVKTDPVVGAVIGAGGMDTIWGQEPVLAIASAIHTEPIVITGAFLSTGAYPLVALSPTPALHTPTAHSTIPAVGLTVAMHTRLYTVWAGAVLPLVARLTQTHHGACGGANHTLASPRADGLHNRLGRHCDVGSAIGGVAGRCEQG